MALAPGTRLGVYEITAHIGEGGMGQVYRARDTKLNRDVALKVLPDLFAKDPDRLARFTREAQTLASLNHPHIAQIYGLEESGGAPALVMELVEGEDLSWKIKGQRAEGKGLPIGDALLIAKQIVDALEAAHEQGIVHRDLKPANIKITPDGGVKVLDFGLAKAVGPAEAGRDDSADLTNSPTWTAGATQGGVILGTAAYMSPEQARGKPVDKRTDIWAFGCVLYAMLAGRPAFGGETSSDIIVSVLDREPDWSALPAGTPAPILRLLQRCLDKNQKTRLRDIGDVRHDIDESLAGGSGVGVQAPASARTPRFGLWLAAAIVLAAIAAVVVWRLQRADVFWRNPLEGATFTRLTDVEGAKQNAVISRDGKFFAFLSDRDGTWDAWVSQIGAAEVHNLTHGKVPEIRNPAVRTLSFSPDGLLITIWNRTLNAQGSALVDGGWAVPTLGGDLRPYLPGIAELDWSSDGTRIVYHPSIAGDPMFVTDPGDKKGHQIYLARPGVHNHFQIWSPNDAFIYFVHGIPLDELDVWRMRPTGGQPEQMTFHNARVTFPAFLDARTLIYLATDIDGSGPWIYAMDVAHRLPHRVSAGVEEYTSLGASADGRRLVATTSRATAGLWRVPIGERPVVASAAKAVTLPTTRSLSPRLASGFMVYRVPRAGTDGLWKLEGANAVEMWSGADGRVIEGVAIAPDGRHIAFVTQKRGLTRVNVMNADGTGAHRLSEDLEVRGAPAWSPDGRWIAIAAVRGGDQRLVKIPADGGAPVELTKDYALDPVWSPGGRFIVYSGADVATTFPVKAVTADGAPKPVPEVFLSRGARRIAFRGGDDTLVLLKGNISRKEFWEVDLPSGRQRQLTDFGREFAIADFDLSPDGREIVFDSGKEASDIVLIDLPAR